MDANGFWRLIDRARAAAGDDGDAVAMKAVELLATMPAGEIESAHRSLWDQLAQSYTAPLWAAAYILHGGCSDDGFEYFRGWLITQGRDVFEGALVDPDSLAELPTVQAAAADWEELECELTLSIARLAYQQATGQALPVDAWKGSYPTLDGDFWFDFGDSDRLAQALPRLTALYAHQQTGG
jgi:hypothetical protein